MTEMCTPTGGLINPAAFPVPTASPATLERQARDLRADGVTVSGIGADIKSGWSGLSGIYTAPESETLFTAVDSVATDGEAVETSTGKAATALETFAEAVREVKRKWTTLTSDSYTFLNSIDTSSDDWKQADGFWNRLVGNESDKVAEHQALLDRADALRREYEQAERDCANGINAGIPDRTNFVSANADGSGPGANEYQHGFDGYLGDVDMAWGGSMETDHGWWVDAGSAVKDFTVGIAEDVGGFVGIHNSEGWFQGSWGDNLWEYHEGNLQSAASLVGMYDAENDSWGFQSWERTADIAGGAWKDAAHAVVPWEEWGERPGYVIGTALLNIGATVAGVALSATGVGAVVGAPLLAWRGSAMLNRMGGDGPSVSTPDVPEFNLGNLNLRLPGRFGGSGAPTFDFDMSDLDTRAYSPTQLAEMRTALDRINGQHSGDPAPDGAPDNRRVTPVNNDNDADGNSSRPRNGDATTDQFQATDDFLDIVNNPENADFGRDVTQRHQSEIDEVDRNAKTNPNREGSWEGNDIESDRPDLEGDPARVPVTPRGDTMEADRPSDTSPEDVYRLTGTGPQDFDSRADTGDAAGGPEARDRTPTVTNSVDNGNGGVDTDTRGGTAVDNGNGNGSGRGPLVTNADNGSGSGRGGDGGSDSGDLDLSGDSGDGPSLTDKPELRRDSTDPADRALLPQNGQRFGDGVQLDRNSVYTVVEPDGVRKTQYVTDDNGNIREIRAESDGWNSRHPEFLRPRPDMTYKVDGYTYQTDSLSRTVSVEGDLDSRTNVRNDDEQSKVNDRGSDYYEQLNQKLRDDFEAAHGREPGPGEVPEYEAIQWDGGHLIGYAEFFGIGERLNQVPMRFDVNQNRVGTALPDIPDNLRGTIDGSYRNIERSWNGILTKKDKWHGFSNPKFNDGSWDAALALNPTKPSIHAKVTSVYDPNMPQVPDPANPGRMLPAPPTKLVVEWQLNGVDMKPQEYNNVPPLK